MILANLLNYQERAPCQLEVHVLGERVDDQNGLKVVSPGPVVYKHTHHVVSCLFSLLQCLHCHL